MRKRSLFRRTAAAVRHRIGGLWHPSVAPRWRARLVADCAIAVGKRSGLVGYRVDIDKEELSRDYILNRMPGRAPGRRLKFLDVGGRDGKLGYLLGNTGPLHFDEEVYARNKVRFDSAYDYFGVDLFPAGPNVLHGNLCDRAFVESYKDFAASFDVIYSNNVFEHLDRPWIAAETLLSLLRPGGICITIVPFAQRYHESPGDYFRYTHKGVSRLFELAGDIRVLEEGYDLRARRYDWQGQGSANDIVPTDNFGAWRETWVTVNIFEKPV